MSSYKPPREPRALPRDLDGKPRNKVIDEVFDKNRDHRVDTNSTENILMGMMSNIDCVSD
ncbi:predicted protein [Sclerotinia sclerotiorum 1980 UF-70]|uniref:Uncharacterized protein n=1 Tax=Sclerotinia sclerotiorum (strain ATCC 18683 / 1980 / Ss-1) TaxID=665079 RepID=A7F658_SCLS1|nr:predicted protein [Sclerotinia sclerotiorum 1980 UF-70]EDN98229.1 predicted protein [Sclerotinia sclerotiorum 1980 UF-70]